MKDENKPRHVHWQYLNKLDDYNNRENDDTFDGFDDDGQPQNIKILPVAITPVGPMPISDVSSSFNIWIMHANFKITKGDVKKIAEVDGIEAVTIFSRYRIRVLIGEMFDPDEIITSVESVLGCENNFSKDIELTDELLSRIEMIRAKINKEELSCYLIYALPNGHLKSFSSNNLNEEFHKHLRLFQSTYEAVGGYLLFNTE